MTDFNNFDFGAFTMNNSGGGDFNSFWERDSVKNENNSFFSDDSKKGKDKQQKSGQQMKFESNKQSEINQISLGAFADPQSPSQMKSSGISKRFNVEKQSEQDFRQPAINLSRDIAEIDVSDFEKVNGGYHFQKQVPSKTLNQDDNYEILKKYLNEPKKMDFNNFFMDLEKNQDVSNSSFLNRKQYSNAQQFQEYKRRLKMEKRLQQQKREIDLKSKQGSQHTHSEISVPKVIEINHFKKKPYSSNLLDEDMVKFNIDEGLESKQPISSGFISLKSNKPTSDKGFTSFHAKTESQRDFFEEQNKKSMVESFESRRSKQPSLPKSKLPMIIDADQNIFETTQEEIKLNNLFNNFKNLMENYNLLRGELKSNTEGHEMIMKQLNSLKDDYNKKQEEYEQRPSQKVIREEASIKSQKPKITKQEAKEKINQIELDIYKKIENLENVVKETFDKDNDEKNNLVWVNPDFKQQSQRSINISKQKIEQPVTPRDESVSKNNNIQQILSPLDLRLNTHYNQEELNKNSRVSHAHSKSVAFSPPPRKKTYEGLCYDPQHISVDQFYKNATVQDNTVVFESFDFIVSARYSFIRSGRKHLKISITVKNKTILSLNNFMVIMYGSVGEVLQISPSKMFVQKFGPEESKTLEAVVDNIKVGGQPIRMQISYRTQRDRKGKVSVKIPRPMTKFMDIKFTHEVQFNQIWGSAKHQLYLLPKSLNFQLIKSTDDIKLIFPFIEISEVDDRQFSYGLVFSILNVEGLFLLKLLCDIEGTASVHLKFDDQSLIGHGKQILDTMNLIMFS